MEEKAAKGNKTAVSIICTTLFLICVGGCVYYVHKKKSDGQRLSQVEKQDEPMAEAAYDANDLIRNRNENSKDSIKDEDLNETKNSLGADTLRSQKMTPQTQMEVKDNQSLGMVSAQIDKAIADNEKSLADPQSVINP